MALDNLGKPCYVLGMTNENATIAKSTKSLTSAERKRLYRSVACPTCGRNPGQPCRRTTASYQHGAYDLAVEHNERIFAAREAHGYTK